MIEDDNNHSIRQSRHKVFMLLAGLTMLGQTYSIVQAQTATLNVTDFGARGDAVQIWVNTVSNSVVVKTTNAFTSGDIGKTVELFGVGDLNSGKNCSGIYVTNPQDLIAIITNVVNGTNIYISGDIPSVTSNGVYCVYGTQNALAFQAAVDAANGTNTIINIPEGNFLMIPPCQYTNFNNELPYLNYMACYKDQAIIIRKGGIHFIGAGRDSTILTSEGAFKNQGGYCLRGMVFNCIGPITNNNNFSLIWDSLTFDGGVQIGQIGNQGIQPANPIDGIGWDGTCSAGLDSGSEPLNSVKIFENCKFQHMRGEMIKGITGSARNETILVTNCVFTDGNATAFNYNFSHTITGCTFSNMYQVEEFYLRYPTNVGSYFINNVCTNISHSFIALNGGTYSNEPYVISNNIFYQAGGNGIATCPATSVLIINNQFICNPAYYSICIVLGEAGYQGYSDNSNIVITANNFSTANIMVEIAGGTSATSPNRVEDVQVYNNSMALTNMNTLALQAYNWSTNVHYFNNNFLTSVTNSTVQFSSGNFNSQYVLVDTNNLYYTRISDTTGKTNYISYANGSRFQVLNSFHAGTVYALTDTNSSQIPSGAQMLIENSNTSSVSIPVYLNSALTSGPLTVPYGQSATFQWNGAAWQLFSQVTSPAPPTDLHIVSP
jgi:hypothetical protein